MQDFCVVGECVSGVWNDVNARTKLKTNAYGFISYLAIFYLENHVNPVHQIDRILHDRTRF